MERACILFKYDKTLQTRLRNIDSEVDSLRPHGHNSCIGVCLYVVYQNAGFPIGQEGGEAFTGRQGHRWLLWSIRDVLYVKRNCGSILLTIC